MSGDGPGHSVLTGGRAGERRGKHTGDLTHLADGMSYRLAAPRHLKDAVRLHGIERELRRDPVLVAAFASAGWTAPRARGKKLDVALLLGAVLTLGVAVSPFGPGQGHPCLPARQAAATAPHASDRPCA